MDFKKAKINKSNNEIQFVEAEDIAIPDDAIVKVKETSKRIIVGYLRIKNINLIYYNRKVQTL